MPVDTRKMADGKQETIARTAWMLELGGVRLRCLREDREGAGRYSLQARSSKGAWSDIGRGADAGELLSRAARSKSVKDLLARLDGVLPGESAPPAKAARR